jgi:DNA primase
LSNPSPFRLPSKKRRELLDRAAAEYNESLPVAQSYLTARGIPIEAANRYQIGYVLDPLPGHERFKNWLSIPYDTPTGVVGMKFRCIQDHDCKTAHGGKYDCEAGNGSRPYAVKNLQADTTFLCIVEGEFDTLVCAELAGMPAVGIPGANNWKKHWQFLFEGFSEVVVIGDGDDAGEKLADRVTSALHNARSVTLPKGEDINSFVVKYGGQALRERAGVDG